MPDPLQKWLTDQVEHFHDWTNAVTSKRMETTEKRLKTTISTMKALAKRAVASKLEGEIVNDVKRLEGFLKWMQSKDGPWHKK